MEQVKSVQIKGENKMKKCYFCSEGKEPNYKDIEVLKKFVHEGGKMKSAKETGTCPKHQKKLNQAIKRARLIAMM